MKTWFSAAIVASFMIGCGESTPANDAGAGGQGGTGSQNGAGASTGGSNSVTGVGDGPGTALTVQEYCTKRVALDQPWCDYLGTCCSADDKADLNFVPPTCGSATETAAECVSNFDAVKEAGVVWDGTWADACLTELAKTIPAAPLSCSGLKYNSWSQVGRRLPNYGQIEACQQTLAGTKKENATCEYSAECGDGMQCSTVTGEATGTYLCLPLGTAGSKCILDSSCTSGLKCVGKDIRQCGVPGDEFSPCLYSSDCADGLVCSGGKCDMAIAPSDACEFNETCEGGYGCGFVTQTCISLKSAGSACSSSFECQGRCDSGTGQCADICGGSLY